MYVIVLTLSALFIFMQYRGLVHCKKIKNKQKVFKVKIKHRRFIPQHIYMKKHDILEIINQDVVRHAIANNSKNIPNSPLLDVGQKYEVGLDQKGEWIFICSLFPKMRRLHVEVK